MYRFCNIQFLSIESPSMNQRNPIHIKYWRLFFEWIFLWPCYAALVPTAPSGVPQGERAKIFDQEGCYWVMAVMVGPFGSPLRVLRLNGIADCPLKRFLTSGLVSRAPNGWPLGLMAPFPSRALWLPLLQLWDTRLVSWPLHTPSWPFSQWILAPLDLVSSEEGILHTKSFTCFE